ncbi:MAG: hypothetical protein AUJ12_00120 [Alphaproteobacteria bacterium CG1_02_46_17]|nr:MAG: hypothetical protein AUJ12_00120 [Alphaproteobacteria bacterium CG1_02_46_17]
MTQEIYDLCIVGGGINGAGIARDAAGRGLKVLLVEQGDFAGCTSSSSSKMIHGGLRYLEFYDFGLVRKSLAEREVLMEIAPQIVTPMEFCIPHQNTIRPAWMVRLGLFIYDHLWPRKKLNASSWINLESHKYGMGLKKALGRGFTYSDCWVDDARLVILNILDAADHGADIRNYTRCTSLTAKGDYWDVSLQDIMSGKEQQVTAKTVVNATGPYAFDFLDHTGHVLNDTPHLRLVQGTHIAVPRVYEGDHAYMLQLPDKRVVFVFPYGKYNLCGTTETEFKGDPVEAMATASERKYLCDALNSHFEKQTKPEEIVWEYSGVRPLFEDSETDVRKLSRDYRLYEDRTNGPLLISVFGGKLTTYRTLSEQVMDLLKKEFPALKRSWTATQALPECPVNLQKPPEQDDLRYFIQQEMARSADDILWRRTKWGIFLDPSDINRIKEQTPELIKEIISHDTAA